MRSNMQSHFRSQYFVAKKSLTISSPIKILSPHRSPPRPRLVSRRSSMFFFSSRSHAMLHDESIWHVLLLWFLSIFGLSKRLLHVLCSRCSQAGKLLILNTRCGSETGLSVLFPIYIFVNSLV